MGQILGTWKTRHLDLHQDDKPSFDSNVGFHFKRAKREMIAKEDHLISARIPPPYRDYCGHKALDYKTCRRKNWPFVYRCHCEKHAYLNCEQADYVLRMKEFERERRLREREIRVENEKNGSGGRHGPRCPD